LFQAPAVAGIRYWVGGSGVWTDTANWALGLGGTPGASVPVTGDTANITLSDGIDRTITYQQPATIDLANFRLGNAGGGALVFEQTQYLLQAGAGLLGRDGTGTVNLSGGTFDIDDLSVGAISATSVGTINLSGTGSFVSADMRLGDVGTGIMKQSGGSATIGLLTLGATASGQGFYTLDAGTLGTTTTIVGGSTGNNLLTQNGGIHTVSGALTINSGSAYDLTDGTLTTGSMTVAGSAAFNFTGGTLNVDYLDAGNGTLTLDGTGGLLNVNTIAGGTFDISNGDSLSLTTITGGSFNLTGASSLAATDITLGAGDGLDVAGGSTLTVTSVTLNSGSSFSMTGAPFEFTTLTQNGGALDTDVTVDAADSFSFNGGVFTGGLVNDGQTGLNSNFTVSGGLVNNASLDVAAGVTVTADGPGLDNNAVLDMVGGTLAGAGSLVNDGTLTSSGSLTVSGSGGFTNNGTLTVTSGSLTLDNSGVNTNTGTLDLAFFDDMTLNTALTSSGTIRLKGGNWSGSGTLTNTVTGEFSGSGAVAGSIVNAGTVDARSGNLTIGGASFTNSGLVRNSVGSNLFVNAATVAHTGSIEVNAAGSVVFSGAVTNSAGRDITLNGGALGTGGLTNASGAVIAGFGSLTGNLVNAGSVDFFGTTSLVGDLDVQATGHFLVRNDQTLITGHTTNNGTIETLNGQLIFEGGLTNNGALLFDPATITVSSLDVGASGYLAETGPPGDRFIITGNFGNASIERSLWSTGNTVFQFNSGTRDAGNPQTLEVAGIDLGLAGPGWTDNFVLGTLEIGSSDTYVRLVDGFDNSAQCLGLYCEIWDREALYVVDLILDSGTTLDLDGFNLYVLNSFTDNGGTILNGSVTLAAVVPLPPSVYLFIVGLIGLSVIARRGRRRRHGGR
jgi:hypothetical protein